MEPNHTRLLGKAGFTIHAKLWDRGASGTVCACALLGIFFRSVVTLGSLHTGMLRPAGDAGLEASLWDGGWWCLASGEAWGQIRSWQPGYKMREG